MKNIYDVVIIGAGPAGMTAAIYAARSNMNVLVVEKGIYGGQMQNTAEIENYPSYINITGEELSEKMYEQMEELGAEYEYGEVLGIKDSEEKIKKVIIKKGKNEVEVSTYSVIIATGTKNKKLGIEGEEKLSGKGISWCAICDGAFFGNQHVYVVGAGDSAVEESMYLTNYAEKVTVLVRSEKMRAQPILQERMNKNEKIEVIWNTEIKEVRGKEKVEELLLVNNKTKEETLVSAGGLFEYIGLLPITEMFDDLGILNNENYIVTNEKMETKIKGIYAVGDVREKTLRQIITASGDGSIAGMEAYKYVEEIK